MGEVRCDWRGTPLLRSSAHGRQYRPAHRQAAWLRAQARSGLGISAEAVRSRFGRARMARARTTSVSATQAG
ncbi:hypothetical protein [Streptomyces sp. NPDC051662]|uniref:hypothetical protein n=1 Tax=Streptomyces sp. NPDC051662 TaxID=3154750 RepID=UPI003426C77C